MVISIDLGYGYTKAVSQNNQVLFPSVIAPAEEGLDFGRSFGHVIEFRKPGEIQKRRLFVGELAQKQGRAAQISLSRDNLAREMSVVLALTAAYLAGAEGQVDVASGLPIAYYGNQRGEVARVFGSVSAYVSVNGGPEKYISFARVHVYPQGVGALYSLSHLPKEGLVGIVDVGFHTTDYLLVECMPEDISPLKGYAGSIETGVSTALKLLSNRFSQAVGAPLPLSNAHAWWVSGRREVKFFGRPVDIGRMIDAVRQEVGRAIGQAVAAAWSEQASGIDTVYLSGGGATEFENEFRTFFPQAELLTKAQFANALGFYKLAGGGVEELRAAGR